MGISENKRESPLTGGEAIASWTCMVRPFAQNGKIHEVTAFPDTQRFAEIDTTLWGDFHPTSFQPAIAPR